MMPKNVTEATVSAQKVLVYATSARGLLVFDEPDFPQVPLQVPGGTIEPEEDPADAACREFLEETGIPLPQRPKPLCHSSYRFVRDGIAQLHARHFFHCRLTGEYPAQWENWETSASDGSAPVRFRLFWLDLGKARERLGLQMGVFLGAVSGS